MHKQDEQKTR